MFHVPRFVLPLLFTASAALAQVPTFTVINTGLETSFSNAGKGIFDPQVSGVTGIAFGNGLFVVVGASGNEDALRWATSPDGTTWTARSQPLGGDLKTYSQSRVHFLNGKFLFFAENTGTGGGGFAYSSADGLTWTRSNVITTGRMLIGEFDASPTLTVAAGNNGLQIASSDLVTWVGRPVVPNAAGFDHLDLAYGATKFFSSINGFGGTTYSSADGVTWTSLAQANNIGGSRVVSGNGMVILTTGSNRYRTTNGTTFTQFTPTVPTGYGVSGGDPWFVGGRFVLSHFSLQTFSETFLSSTDGQTWTEFAKFPVAPTVAGQSRLWAHTDMAFGNGKYVLAANDAVQTLTSRSMAALIMVLDAPAAPTPPTVTLPPLATSAVLGGSATFAVTATGTGNTYQWRKDNTNIPGATAASLTLTNVTAASAGSYSVVITNAAGTVTSGGATLSLVAASDVGRLVNMSIRTTAGSGDGMLIVGVALGGRGTAGTKAVLLRAAGPTLTAFGVGGALADPVLTVFQGTTQIAQNDDWSGGFDFSTVGAFAFSGTTPRDAGYYNAAVPAASYSIQIAGKNNQTGIALAEIYDATPASSFAATTPRLVNVSARTQVGTGDNILIAGFAVGGSSPVRVLIRAAGPALTPLGVGGALADPRLEVFNAGNSRVAENDNWSGTAALKDAFQSVAAFAFPADTSRDAALVATLPPGTYTAQISGVGNTTGVALVEIYELP